MRAFRYRTSFWDWYLRCKSSFATCEGGERAHRPTGPPGSLPAQAVVSLSMPAVSLFPVSTLPETLFEQPPAETDPRVSKTHRREPE